MTPTPPPADPAVTFLNAVRDRIGTVVVGQDEVVDRLLIALLTGGHLLLEGVPGLAKTLLVSCLAKCIDLQFKRVQFTVDLLPADVLGSEILDAKTHEFRVSPGPVFTNLLLADEINRAAPKVQSALLEAMQERKVTLGRETLALPAPFLVIATQNPVEQAGTFELPEAQLDRFLLRHRLTYPDRSAELEVLRRNAALGVERRAGGGAVAKSEFDVLDHRPVGTADDLSAAMEATARVHVSDAYLEHVMDVVSRTRSHPAVDLGASPRAGIALVKAAKARAVLKGRGYVLPDDLYALAPDVLLHRMRLTYEAAADGVKPDDVLTELLHGPARIAEAA